MWLQTLVYHGYRFMYTILKYPYDMASQSVLSFIAHIALRISGNIYKYFLKYFIKEECKTEIKKY